MVHPEVWLQPKEDHDAGKKRHTPEEIVSKLRQVDVLVAQGTPVVDAVRTIGVTEVTYYRWRQEYGGLKSDQVKRMKALETENQRLRKAVADLTLDKLILQGGGKGKLLSPARRRACVEHIRSVLTISERRACRALGQHRSTQRKAPRGKEDEEALTADLIELARQYGRYGYRKIAALLRDAGWLVNDKRVERIWRREGLKVPASSPSAAGCGSRTGPVSGCGPSTPTTSGPTTSSRTAPMMAQVPHAQRHRRVHP